MIDNCIDLMTFLLFVIPVSAIILFLWKGRNAGRTLLWLIIYTIAFVVIFSTKTPVYLIGYKLQEGAFFLSVFVPFTLLAYLLEWIIFTRREKARKRRYF